MKSSPGPRKTANLSEATNHQLNMYALAASAAGVGVLALAQPADARIVYTPAHRVIKAHTSYQLDLNHDKTIDFTISNSARCATDECFYSLVQEPAAGNSGMAVFKGYLLASALKRGARIGPGGQFQNRTAAMVGIDSAYPFSYVFGEWVNVQRRYLGLRFKIKGQTHYGWARLNVQVVLPPHPAITAVLTGYAYETIPGKSIKAGQTKEAADDPTNEDSGPGASPTKPIPDKPKPASLGMLALGAHGGPLWRRKESLGGRSGNN